jgi:phosphoribosylamine-glycine ligase
MLTPNGPKLLEYNCRFGDPETQAVLMLLESDLFDIMTACATGKLGSFGKVETATNCSATTVVMASQGYPGKYPKGKVITGIADADKVPGVKVFHAGTKVDDKGSIITTGGRVLAVSAKGKTLPEALAAAYQGVSKISFEGAEYRTDIAKKALPSGFQVEAAVERVKETATVVLAKASEQRGVILAAAGAFIVGAVLLRVLQRD